VRRPSGAVRGVALASDEIVEGDAVVVAMGPWSWPRAGCRCRWCLATRAIAWCLKRVGPFRPRHCSSSTARRAAATCVLFGGDVDHRRRALADPRLLGHRAVADDVLAERVLELPRVAPLSRLAVLEPEDARGHAHGRARTPASWRPPA
jgi:hypothetical protein